MLRKFASLFALILVTSVGAQAHEGRCVTSTSHPSDPCYYLLFVGFKSEPALAKQLNGLDVLIAKNISGAVQGSQTTSIPDLYSSVRGSDPTYAAVDVGGDDMIANVTAKVLRLKSQVHVTSESDPNIVKVTTLKPYFGYDDPMANTMPGMGNAGPLVQSMDPAYNFEYVAPFLVGPGSPINKSEQMNSGVYNPGDMLVAAYGFHIQATVNGDPINEYFVCGMGSTNPTHDAFSCVGAPQKAK